MFKEQFKDIRAKQGLTQKQLALLIRLKSDRAISQFETGERRVSGPVSLIMDLLDAGLITEIEAVNRIEREER